MASRLKLHVFCSFQSCLIFTAIRLFLFASSGYSFPESPHMLLWDDLITNTTEHEYGCRCRDQWDFGCRVPFLVTQKRKRAESWKCVWYQTRKRSERIFQYQGIYLSRMSTQKKSRVETSSLALSGFRLARSIATAPPIDCPYRTFIFKKAVSPSNVN